MDRYLNYIKNITRITFFLIVIGVAVYGGLNGWFESVEALQEGIESLGIFGVVGFVFLQILQVIVPIVPNQIVGVAGVVIFGPVFGFVYNYMGVCIGSLIVFELAKNYGNRIIEKIFSQKLMDKYRNCVDSKKFTTIFGAAIICPGLPDDFLCYLAGTSKIKYKYFLIIILIGRATSQIGYSLFLNLFYTY